MNGREVRRNHSGNYNNYGSQNRNEPKRNRMIPNEPPYTAYIGNTPDTMVQGDFEKQLFTGLKVKQVRLVRDRQTDRFRGFAYVEFEDADSLRSAIALDGMFVNDRPIRIDVASRPLGAPKSEGFRNKPNFESRNGPRQPSGNKNNNNNNNNYQTNDRFRQDGNQRGTGQITENSHYRNGNNHGYHNQVNSDNDNEQKSQSQNKRITSQISDDVFITPDTAVSNEDDNDEHLNSKEDSTTITRQQSRNWADCPIDESVIETSSSTNNNTTSNDDVDNSSVRNQTSKSRLNQRTPPNLMNNQSMHGRNTGNYSQRHIPSQMSGNERTYNDRMTSSYSNQSQQHHNSQTLSNSGNQGSSSYYNNNRPPSISGSRQRLNSNGTTNNRDEKNSTSTSNSLHDINSNTISAENRPRLQLLPRSQKVQPSTNDNQSKEPATRNTSIFGCGKPRDERDPKIAELNKHIEEVVEKDINGLSIKSTTSNEPTNNIIKPIRILSARTESSTTH
ncbi:unnamed protein product [Adineta steineri]|uniref:Eukaryotic translation initiation factor 4H n=2 Tax=Adineta steineri TaxID=433720 RepID=A0A819CZI3_9BILA|nr:unnamed protein product [Adineta steineri]